MAGPADLDRGRDARERGQVLVLFTLTLVALLSMAALLFDASQSLVLRRQLQNATDTAALAAANVLQSGTPRGCSATGGATPGAPRQSVIDAARAAVLANLPGYPVDQIIVVCAPNQLNSVVEVRLAAHSPSFFGGVIGFAGFDVGAIARAVNGQMSVSRYSIIELDPWEPTWPNGRRGCPSVLISGGPTLVLDGNMHINSACPAANGGALGTNGNSATITFNNESFVRMVGGYVQGPLTITPPPRTGAPVIGDPLAALPPIPVASLPVRSNARLVIGGGSQVLEPGVFVGGVQLRNTARAYLRPGIYVMQGGGFDMGAQNAVYSVAAGASSTTDATWTTDCAAGSCGVLLFNTGTASGSGAMGQMTVGAGATLRLRPYTSTGDGTGVNAPEYDNLLFWQDRNPVPTSAFAQPTVALNGGGSVQISGTVYAPSALVTMGGGSGGSGGSTTELTLQFISWDLQFSGNSAFRFYYRSDAFARPTDYGLVE